MCGGVCKSPQCAQDGCATEARRETVLEEAERIVSGPRRAAYGHPADNHGCTAMFWRAYVHRRYGVDVPIDAEDVTMFNSLQKISRHAHVRQRDNLVDVAGFVRNAELLAEHDHDDVRPDGEQDSAPGDDHRGHDSQLAHRSTRA